MFSRKILSAAIVALILTGAGCTTASTTTNIGAPVPQSGAQTTLPAVPQTPSAPTPGIGAPATAGNSVVIIQNFAFSPADITVKKGGSVTWKNRDQTPHIIASDSGVPGLLSAPLSNGGEFTFTFDQVGDYGYHCQIHPSMTGSVRVIE